MVPVEEQGELPYVAVAHQLHCQIVLHSLGITARWGKGYRNLGGAGDAGGCTAVAVGFFVWGRGFVFMELLGSRRRILGDAVMCDFGCHRALILAQAGVWGCTGLGLSYLYCVR